MIRENDSFLSSFFDCQIDRPSVIGMIARVRVNLTIVACSRIDVPCKLSQELAVAVTDEVSLTAVPANMAKPWLLSPNQDPKWGKIKAAKMLKKKITETAVAIDSSFALMTGAVAAIAEPPQIEEPTPTKVVISLSNLNSFWMT